MDKEYHLIVKEVSKPMTTNWLEHQQTSLERKPEISFT